MNIRFGINPNFKSIHVEKIKVIEIIIAKGKTIVIPLCSSRYRIEESENKTAQLNQSNACFFEINVLMLSTSAKLRPLINPIKCMKACINKNITTKILIIFFC